MNKLQIDRKAVDKIKSFAHNHFMESDFRNMRQEDIQVVCILEGLYNYLKSEGQEPQWQNKLK